MENTAPLALPARTRRPIKGWAIRFLKLSAYGLISGALTVGIITATYLAITRSFDVWSVNSTGSGTQQTIWLVTLYLFAVLFGVITAVGLPIMWGKSGGFRKVFMIMFLEAFYVAIALLISAFFFFKTAPPSTNPNCPTPTYGNTYANPNCSYNPGGPVQSY